MGDKNKPARRNTDSVADILGPELAAELGAGDSKGAAPAAPTEASSPAPATAGTAPSPPESAKLAPASTPGVGAPAADASPAKALAPSTSAAAGTPAATEDRFAVSGLPLPPTGAASLAAAGPIPSSGAPLPPGVARRARRSVEPAVRGSGIPGPGIAEPAQQLVAPWPAAAPSGHTAPIGGPTLEMPAPDLPDGDGSTSISTSPTSVPISSGDSAPARPVPHQSAGAPRVVSEGTPVEPTEIAAGHVAVGAVPTMIVEDAPADAAGGEGGLVVFDPGAGEEWPSQQADAADEHTLIGRSVSAGPVADFPIESLRLTAADLGSWFGGQRIPVKVAIAGGAGVLLLGAIALALVASFSGSGRSAFLVATQPLQSGPGGANAFPSVAILERNERISELEEVGDWVLVRDEFGRVGYVVAASLYDGFPPTPQGETFTLCRRRPGEDDAAACNGRAAQQFASCRHRCESAGDDATCLVICSQLGGDCERQCESLPISSAFDSETHAHQPGDAPAADEVAQPDEDLSDESIADTGEVPDGDSIIDADATESSGAKKKKARKKKSKRRKKRKKR